MKHMTLFILPEFLILMFIKPVLFNEALPDTLGSVKENSTISLDTISFSRDVLFRNITFYEKTNRAVDLRLPENYLIVLKNNHNCLDCFRELSNEIHDKINCSQFHYCTLSCIDSSALSRKREYAANTRLMPYVENYLFYYCKSWNYFERPHEKLGVVDNFFYQTGVDITPAILLLSKDKALFIKYKSVFEPDMVTLSKKTTTIINCFYN